MTESAKINERPGHQDAIVLPHQSGWYWVFTADSIQRDFTGGLVDGSHWYPLFVDTSMINDDGTNGAIQFKGEFYPLCDFVGVFGPLIQEPSCVPERDKTE